MGTIAACYRHSGLIPTELSTSGAPDNDRCNSTFGAGSTVYIASDYNGTYGYEIGDIAYTIDSEDPGSVFDGQDLWWRLRNSNTGGAYVVAYQIDSSGEIQAVQICGT